MSGRNKKAAPPAPDFNWAVPESLGIPPDPLRLRLDFHNQAVTMTLFEGDVAATKIVSATDIAQTLASELSYSTGLLPANVLWWTNTAAGPVTAIYEEPRIRRVALQESVHKPAQRFAIPLPGLVFLSSPGQPPLVVAVKKRPTKSSDEVFHAPLCNVFQNGATCPGNHKYPSNIGETVESFFVSFFSSAGQLSGRSKKHPDSVVKLWKFLDRKKEYPLDDLVRFGTVKDLMTTVEVNDD